MVSNGEISTVAVLVCNDMNGTPAAGLASKALPSFNVSQIVKIVGMPHCTHLVFPGHASMVVVGVWWVGI